MRELANYSFENDINIRLLRKLASFYFTIIVMVLFILSLSSVVSNFVSKNLSLDYHENAIIEIEDGSLSQFDETILDENLLSTIFVAQGDTLSSIFLKESVSNSEINQISKALRNANISLIIKPGQKIIMNFDNNSEKNEKILSESTIFLDEIKKIILKRDFENNIFTAELIESVLQKKYIKNEVEIKGSFTNTLKSLGINNSDIHKIVSALTPKINFQKNIKEGDFLTVIHEKLFTEEGKFFNSGRVIHLSLRNSDKLFGVYLYDDGKKTLYLNDDGITPSQTVFHKPLKNLRVTSPFGRRKHPILGISKMHTGVDFGAPRGTPIYCASDGVVISMGYKGGYGKIIEVRHNGKIVTAYAHASKFASNVKVGSKVKKGQVIAYVGSTGMSTSPHLHYEVRVNGRHVNPLSIKTIDNKKMTAEMDKKFKKLKSEIVKISSSMESGKLYDEIDLN